MTLRIVKCDLFLVPDRYYKAHCISADYALGKGIATNFQQRYRIREQLLATGSGKYPKSIKIGRVFNLVTKQRYFHKPTYDSIREALKLMALDCEANSIKYLAMPKIGSGLDRLQWDLVQRIIYEVFSGVDIEIVVCIL